MNVVIIGKNEHMERLYQKACFGHGCKRARVFTKTAGKIKKKLRSNDLYILFTNTVSHKRIIFALGEARQCNTYVERCHGSLCVFKPFLRNYRPEAACAK